MSSIPRKILSQLFIILTLLAISSLVIKFASQPVFRLLGYSAKSGISITATPQAKVLIDQVEVGNTPLVKEDLSVGEHQIRLESKTIFWQTTVRLEKGVVTTVNRELAISTASSSGEIVSLYQGRGVNITSVPINAQVQIDDKIFGSTPLMIDQIPPGEHTFFLTATGFISRQIRASIPDGYRLNIHTDLAVSQDSLDPPAISKVTVLQKGVVLDTGVGFLRVREAPQILAKELTRIKVGDNLVVISELEEWFKVRLADGTEGFVAAEFVRKQ